jgi:hypothetical protein
MLYFIPDFVLNSSSLKDSEKLLCGRLLALCQEDPKCACTLSNDDLAQLIGCTNVTVSNGIKALVNAGLFTAPVDQSKSVKRIIEPTDLLKKSLRVTPNLLKEILRGDSPNLDLLKEILRANEPLKENFKSLLKNFLRANDDNSADKQQVIQAVKNNFKSNDEISGNAGNSIYNNISSSTNSSTNIPIYVDNNLLAQKPENSSEPAEYVLLNGKTISPAELGPLLNIRGVEHERVEPFVAEHNARSYNDIKELADLVRKWLRRTRPKQPRKSVSQRKLEFKEKIREYDRLNPGKYPADHYNEFYKYWTVTNEAGTTMRFEKDNYFDLAGKLAWVYKNIYLKNQSHAANNSTASKNSKTVPILTADDFGDGDGSPADSVIESDDETGTGDYTTLHCFVE